MKWKPEFEFLFWNDGSHDHKMDFLQKNAVKDKRVFYYSFSEEFGKEAVRYAGFCNTCIDDVAVMNTGMRDLPVSFPEII